MSLEKQIYETIAAGLGEAIKSRLNQGYNDNPLNRLVDQVVASRSGEIQKLLEDSVDAAFKADFREAIRDAVTHKLAKILVSKMEGEIEKQANQLRSHAEFRARVTVAIAAVIKSFSP